MAVINPPERKLTKRISDENRKTPPSGYYVLNVISYFALFRAKTKFCTIYCVLVTKKSPLDKQQDLSLAAGVVLLHSLVVSSFCCWGFIFVPHYEAWSIV